MTNVLHKFVEKNKTHITYSKFFFFQNRAIYEIKKKNTGDPNTPQKTIRRIHDAT